MLPDIEPPGRTATAARRERRLRDGIAAIGSPLVAGVRGRGLLLGIGLTSPVAKAVVAAAQEHGLIVNAANDDTIRIAPPLTIGDAEVAAFLELFGAALATVSDALILEGAPA